MKTISVNNRGNMFKVLAVVGALTALYFYRRRGGSVSGLIEQSKTLAGRVRDQATEIYNGLKDTDTDDVVADAKATAKSAAKEVTHQAKSRLQTETSSVH